MKMMIPPLGARIRLTANWSFDLHYDYRNENVYELFGVFQHLRGAIAGYEEDAYPPLHRIGSADKEPARATLPAGTLLTLDRYYIRQGTGDFDSVTFALPSQPLAAPSRVCLRQEAAGPLLGQAGGRQRDRV